MPTLLRRFVVVTFWAIWFGGFTFYTGLAIPIGQDVLGSGTQEGFVTQSVTHYLNLLAGITLVPLAWDIVVAQDKSAGRRRGRWLTLAALAVTLGSIVWIHARIDDVLDVEGFRVFNRETFRFMHRMYLIVSTVQWLLGLGFVAVTLSTWRAEDSAVIRQ